MTKPSETKRMALGALAFPAALGAIGIALGFAAAWIMGKL